MNNTDIYVGLEYYQKKMKKKGLSFREVEKQVFKKGLLPLRFKKNQTTISQKEQYRLFKSHVSIVGCGGLGGNVAELLARVGVGEITLIDSDKFVEHNLNRQKFSTIKTLGERKVDTICSNLKLINPALLLHKKYKYLNKKNIDKLLNKSNVVIDCLDNPKKKMLLSSWCKQNSKKFVHGAIAGTSLQITTSKNLDSFYKTKQKGIEKIYGNLAFIASICASFQVSFCIKLLLDKDFSFDDMLFCDLNDFEFINLPIN